MQTRREQVRAYNYQVKRLVRGVLMGRPEHWDQPFRRSTIGTVVGMILALIAVVGCVLLGLLRPGAGPELAADTTVVVEKDTGTRYVVADGTLRPVANLASALLLAGPQLHVQSLPPGRTRSLPRGTAVGIVGAPDDVPGADGVSKAGWSVCLRATTATTGLAPSTVIAFTGTQQLTRQAPGQGLLVAGPDGMLYLVVADTRYAIATAEARNALGYAATVPLRATKTWLAVLRPGRMITTLDVDHAGSDGPRTSAGTTKVGTVLAVHQLTGTQYFLVQRTKIVPLTRFEALLLMGSPKLAKLYPHGQAPIVIPESAIAAASRQLLPTSFGWPADPVDPVPVSGRSICVAAGNDGAPWLGLGPADAGEAGDTPSGSGGSKTVLVRPGSAVVAEETNPAGGSTGAVWLVDDTGRSFAVADGESLGALGLDQATKIKVPTGLLTSIQRGPTLSIQAAQEPVTSAKTAPTTPASG
jgi:type VII secretion protein EccB